MKKIFILSFILASIITTLILVTKMDAQVVNKLRISDFGSISESTVSSLPSSGNWTGRAFTVTDGDDTDDCTTGSGSTRVDCRWDGSAWAAVGGDTTLGAHASTHQNGGADEVATATPGANAIPKAEADGDLANGWIGLDQDYTWTGFHDLIGGTWAPPSSVVGSLPTCNAGNDQKVFIVSDGADDADCSTGAGSTILWCYCDNGVGYIPLPAGGSTPGSHATTHSLGGGDQVTVTNLASGCTDAQVLGGDAGGTGVECQTDDDVPESGDFGAAADLESTGAISANAVDASKLDETDNYTWTGLHDFIDGEIIFAESAVGDLPTCNAGNDGKIFITTDSDGSSDCSTGSGSDRAICRCEDGTGYEALGGGGGGSSEWTDGGNYLTPADATTEAVSVGVAAEDGKLSVYGDTTTQETVVIRGVGSQSAELLTIEDSDENPIFVVGSDGQVAMGLATGLVDFTVADPDGSGATIIRWAYPDATSGYAEFAYANTDLINKWGLGAVADTYAIAPGNNTFYLYRYTDSTDVAANQYEVSANGDTGFLAVGYGDNDPETRLHIRETNNGDLDVVTIENMLTNSSSSTNETANIDFGFGGVYNVASIKVGKEGDYTSGADEDSFIEFLTDENGTLGSALRLQSDKSLLLASLAAPVTDAAAEFGFDNNAWDTSRGALQLHDGTASVYLLGALTSDTPSDGQVAKFNTGGTITWEDDETGSVGGSSEIVFDIQTASVPANDGAALIWRESSAGTPERNWWEALFTTGEHLMWSGRLPEDFATSTAPVCGVQYKMVSAEAEVTEWSCGIACTTPGDAVDFDADTFASVNASADDTVPGTAGHVAEHTWNMTNDDGCAAGDSYEMYFLRSAPAGTDATGEAEALRFFMNYTP